VNGKVSWPLFWALIAVFILIVCFFFVEPLQDLLSGSELFLAPFIIFFLLGIALLVFTLREKVAGKLKAFFLLTGASAAGFFVSFLLHNAVYGLFVYFFGEGFWGGTGGDEPFFFILALIVCPLGFLVGAIGSILFRIKGAASP
jgi:hypothetical protein